MPFSPHPCRVRSCQRSVGAEAAMARHTVSTLANRSSAGSSQRRWRSGSATPARWASASRRLRSARDGVPDSTRTSSRRACFFPDGRRRHRRAAAGERGRLGRRPVAGRRFHGRVKSIRVAALVRELAELRPASVLVGSCHHVPPVTCWPSPVATPRMLTGNDESPYERRHRVGSWVDDHPMRSERCR
jgi:hypothetical protein